MAYGDDKVLPHEYVYLAELNSLRLVQVMSWPEHYKERLAVALELGPLVCFDSVLTRQGMQPELLGDGFELFLGGLVNTDPGHPTPLATHFASLTQRAGFCRPATVHVDGVVHDHRTIIPANHRDARFPDPEYTLILPGFIDTLEKEENSTRSLDC